MVSVATINPFERFKNIEPVREFCAIVSYRLGLMLSTPGGGRFVVVPFHAAPRSLSAHFGGSIVMSGVARTAKSYSTEFYGRRMAGMTDVILFVSVGAVEHACEDDAALDRMAWIFATLYAVRVASQLIPPALQNQSVIYMLTMTRIFLSSLEMDEEVEEDLYPELAALILGTNAEGLDDGVEAGLSFRTEMERDRSSVNGHLLDCLMMKSPVVASVKLQTPIEGKRLFDEAFKLISRIQLADVMPVGSD